MAIAIVILMWKGKKLLMREGELASLENESLNCLSNTRG